MKRKANYCALLLIAAMTVAACGAKTSEEAATPKAIFIIVDGIPADVLESVHTPTFDAIAGDRGYTRSYVGGEAGGESESPTVSAVGYNHVLTGTWSNKHNVRTNSISSPNYDYWDIFRIAKTHDEKLQTAIFSTWLDNRTKLVGDGLLAAGGDKIDYAFDGFEHDETEFPHDDLSDYIRKIDEHVATEAARFVLDEGPDLSWVYLEYTDDVSHRFGDGPEFQDAVQWMDAQVGRIWQSVEQRAAASNEDWLVIVTTDHGRDAETGRDHGGQTDRERSTWIVTNSQRLNERFVDLPPAVDILPTIARHLNLTIPDDIQAGLDGQSFID